MELEVIKEPAQRAKSYNHLFEDSSATDADLAGIAARIDEAFGGRGCQRILIVQCPQIDQDTFNWDNARAKRYPSYPPYGPALMVRIIEDNGYDADILDLDYELLKHANEVEGTGRYDIWRDKLASKIDEFRPDAVGVSCMYNRSHQALKDIMEYLEMHHPGVARVAGGVHVSLTVDQLMADIPGIHFAMLYEADQSFIDFLGVVNGTKRIESLTQIATQCGGKLIKLTKRAAPEHLPYSPDYKDLPIELYASVGKIGAYTFLRPPSTPTASVLSARGCRAKCGFCSVRSVNGVGVRVREYHEVIGEIRRLRDGYGITHVTWLDDDLLYDTNRATAMFEELAEANLGVTWDASNGVIAAALNPRMLKACVASGCVGFNLGIESGNPEMLLMMKKPGTVQSFRRAAKYLADTPEIFTKGFLVIGFPNETLAMLLDTVNLAVEMQLDWYPIQILTPMPGTPIFQMMQDQGLLGDIPATTLGKARTFSVGAMGGLGKRERLEKEVAKDFNYLFSGDLSRVPERPEMEDLWLCIDYKINYEIIIGMDDLRKVKKKRDMLLEICQRMTSENALGTLFLALCYRKLGNGQEAIRLARQAHEYLEKSAFWQKRFSALGIEQVFDLIQQ